uniref:Uncharacterized protein n=1 Tax=candidate division WOR-3 bacterium TaxID=2052148 RepID=A0A7V4E3A1_UNCW3
MKKYLIFLILFIFACLYLDNVNQPQQVGINEYFTILIQGTFNNSATGRGWLAIKIPLGVRVDSIRYNTYNGATELLTQVSDTVTKIATRNFPPEPNMVWQGYETREYSGLGSGSYEAQVYLYVTNNALPNTYLIDYRTGSSYHNHLLLDSILDQPLTIVTTGIKDQTKKKTKLIRYDILGRRLPLKYLK